MRRLDSKRELIEYFKRNISKGYTPDSLKFALINQGYSRAAISQAIETANKEIAEKAPQLKEKPIIKYELYDENNKKVHIEPLKFWEKIKFWIKGRNF
ncbi:MAG: hypothetical protein U9Q99_02020 [Nanoarchaeota archaeon]|nr:hypothetical protein [Nanoarchaeota archaeon]